MKQSIHILIFMIFCLRLRINSQFEGQYHTITPQMEKKIDKLSKNTRYYISNRGGSLYKCRPENGKLLGVSVGFITTLFNKYEEKEMNDYDINYRFYNSEANKIINIIESKQLTLF